MNDNNIQEVKKFAFSDEIEHFENKLCEGFKNISEKDKPNNIVLEPYEDEKFRYMMLSRLQGDCEYFLGWGKMCVVCLRSNSIEIHITEMKRLWNSLPEKPEWLSMEQIEKYETDMKNPNHKPRL